MWLAKIQVHTAVWFEGTSRVAHDGASCRRLGLLDLDYEGTKN